MRRYVLLLAAALVAFLAAIFWFGVQPMDERTQLLFNQSSGTITEGAMLGVTVGDSWTDADAALRRRFKPDYILWQSYRQGTERESVPLRSNPVVVGHDPILVGDAAVSYRDKSWRNGVVTLRLTDGVVRAIEWGYGGPFYVDL